MSLHTASPIELDVARQYVGDDDSLLRELLTLFLEIGPIQVDSLRGAVARDEHDAIMGIAHTLKGTLLAIGAREAAYLAASLEDMGRTKDTQQRDPLFASFESEVGDVFLAALKVCRAESM